MKKFKVLIISIIIFLTNTSYVFLAGGEELEHNPYETSILNINILGSNLAQLLLIASLILFFISFFLFYLSRRNKNI